MFFPQFKKKELRNSLVVQWLGLSAFNAKGLDSIPGQGTKIPVWLGQKKREGIKKTPQDKKLNLNYF